jgi:hypothetical protein
MIRVVKHVVIAELTPSSAGKQGPFEAAFAAIGKDRDLVSESELATTYDIDHPDKDGTVSIDVSFIPRPGSIIGDDEPEPIRATIGKARKVGH